MIVYFVIVVKDDDMFRGIQRDCFLLFLWISNELFWPYINEDSGIVVSDPSMHCLHAFILLWIKDKEAIDSAFDMKYTTIWPQKGTAAML